MLGIAACGDIPTEVETPIAVTPTEIAFHVSGVALDWVAYQDGNGAWTEVKSVASERGHTYTFTMTAPVGGIAVTDALSCSAVNWVDYGTPAELKAMYSGSQSSPAGQKRVHGRIAGGLANQYSYISLGGRAGGHDWIRGESGDITLEGIPSGPQDLVAARDVNWDRPDKIILRRNLDAAHGDTIPLLDFNSAEAIALDSARLTVQDLGGNALTTTWVSASVYTANGGWGRTSGPTPNGTTWYRGLPVSATIPGDMHQIGVSAADRYVDMIVGPLANHTVTLGPAAPTPTVTTLSSGSPMRRSMTIPLQSEYSRSASALFESGTRPYYYVYMTMTAAYRGSASSWVFEIPDFGAASGYKAAWGIQPGPRQDWSASVFGWDRLEKFIPAVGMTRRSASVSSRSVTPSALPSFGEIESRHPARPTSSDARYARFSCLPV